LAEAFGAASAAELRAVGIDVNFAPVLDVDSNPRNPVIGDRAFSEDPHTAAALGIAFAKGSLSRGILPVGKHFPGHGDTSADSHEELPVVRAGRQTLLRRELLPFRRAARAGIPALMTAHVLYPALDRAVPAILSRKILHDLLRERLRFRGAVISDALEMKAIADRYGIGEAAVLAVTAGCDVVLVCRGESVQAETIDRLARETRDRPTFRRAVAAAAVRSGRLRAWAASKERCRRAPRAVGAARHRELASLLLERWESSGRTSPDGISGNIGEG
jgi:beta-N-acetylhexosaminidase